MWKKIAVLAVAVVVLASVAVGGMYYQLTSRVMGDFFDAEGVRLHYTDEGQGEPLILIHGFGANADMNWREPGITDALAQHYRVISIDNRGHGLSDKPYGAEHYGMEMVKDVARLMDHLEIDKAHIVGYSMGGFITMKFAIEYPGRCLTASPCGMGWDEMTPELQTVMDNIVVALEKGEGFKPLLDFLEIEVEVGPLGGRIGNFVVNTINDQRALADVMRGFGAFAVTREELAANTVPMLSMVGTKDPLKKGVENMEGWVPRHEFLYLEGGDHLTALRNPLYVETLLAFLAKHPAPMQEAA